MLEKLKKKWEIKSNLQLFLILLTFACTGFTVVFIRPYLLDLLGLERENMAFWHWILYILLVFPVYQVLLLMYGFLFGQFSFFWQKSKAMFNKIKSLF